MHAREAIEQIETIVETLNEAKTKIEENDTCDFDIDRKLNVIEEISAEVTEYVVDQT